MEGEYPTMKELDAARKKYGQDENIMFHSSAKAIHTDNGVWLEAWLWVDKSESEGPQPLE